MRVFLASAVTDVATATIRSRLAAAGHSVAVRGDDAGGLPDCDTIVVVVSSSSDSVALPGVWEDVETARALGKPVIGASLASVGDLPPTVDAIPHDGPWIPLDAAHGYEPLLEALTARRSANRTRRFGALFGLLSTRARQVAAAIVGLGAVIAAITAILGLLPSPAPEVTAKVGAIDMDAETTLEEYQATQVFTALPRPPGGLTLARYTLASASDDQCPTPEEVSNGLPVPEGCPAEGVTCPTDEEARGGAELPEGCPPPPACPTPEEVSNGTAVPDGCPAEGVTCPTDEEARDGAEIPEGCHAPPACPTEAEIDNGVEVPAGCPPEGTPNPPDLSNDYEMGPSCAQNPLGRHCALGPLAESAGARPSQSRDQGIKRVRKVLEGTRTTVSESGKGEPLGVALSFDVTVTGLRGRDVQIYWSMLSADTDQALGRSWLKNTRATTLRPKHETDQFRTDLWLPLPKPEGDYVARVTLLGPEGGRLTSARSRVFH